MANSEFSTVSGDKLCCRLSRRAQVCLGVCLLALLILLVVVVVVAVVLPRWRQQWSGSGTTSRFPETVLARCVKYTEIHPEMRWVGD